MPGSGTYPSLEPNASQAASRKVAGQASLLQATTKQASMPSQARLPINEHDRSLKTSPVQCIEDHGQEKFSNLKLLLPSTKECNYEIRISQTSSILTKFIVNNVSIYVSK
jgi:hypothetical protein